MALSHQLMTVYASAALQLSLAASVVPDYCQGLTISVQNVGGGDVYLGNNNTSSTSYGFKLSPGQAFSIDLDPFDGLYARSSDTSSQLAVTRLTWQ